MNLSLYRDIPTIPFPVVHFGWRKAHQEPESVEPGQKHSGGARWAPVTIAAVVLYLLLSAARMWGPTALAAVLPMALFGLTRSIYRAAALTLH